MKTKQPVCLTKTFSILWDGVFYDKMLDPKHVYGCKCTNGCVLLRLKKEIKRILGYWVPEIKYTERRLDDERYSIKIVTNDKELLFALKILGFNEAA